MYEITKDGPNSTLLQEIQADDRGELVDLRLQSLLLGGNPLPGTAFGPAWQNMTTRTIDQQIAEAGAERLTHSLDHKASQIAQKVDNAVLSLSEARREASGSVLARRRNVGLLPFSQPLQGLPQALCCH